jgi:ERCC4-type nuclease
MTKTIEIGIRITDDDLDSLIESSFEKSEDEKSADAQLVSAIAKYEESHPKDEPCFLSDEDDYTPIDKKKQCPFTIIVDSREQAPFSFLNIDQWLIIPLQHVGLETGDYSMIGFQSRITIERKSISDFLGSITSGRERFEREFERMSKMEYAAVVVEGDLSEVLQYANESTKIHPKSIVGTIDCWRIRYGVEFIFCESRRHAERQTFGLLYQFWREEQKRFKTTQASLHQ